jgi:hypothetical protein
MESHFISEYNTLLNGYNSTRGGESGLGNKWWNNGTYQVFTECPPDETFIRGRLKFNNIGSKIGADKQRGKVWVNNGSHQMMIRNDVMPEGYRLGRLPSPKRGRPNPAAKGTLWWNDGVTQHMAVDCPGPNFRRGRLSGISK